MTEVPNPDEAELPTIDDDNITSPEPEPIKLNDATIKDAQEQLSTLDVLVCGQCHSVFHFVEEFSEHRDSAACSGKSPIRDSNETKPQVWAFLLWKCSLPAVEVGTNSGWRLYQQWCRMPAPRREAWLTAGKEVQDVTKFASSIHVETTKVEISTSPYAVTTNSLSYSLPHSGPKRRGRPPKKKKDDDISITGTEIIDQADHDKLRLLATLEGNDEEEPKASIFKKLGSDITVVKSSAKDRDMAGAQERVPISERMAKRSDRPKDSDDDNEPGEFVVEKILAKRFNPKKKQHEYLLKWEGYPHEQNTWEPVENMETCKHLLDAFEKQLARQKEMKALRAQQIAASDATSGTPALTPTGRLQRSSKVRAMDCVKAWCGAGGAAGEGGDDDDLPPSKKIKKETSSDDEDFKLNSEDTPNLKMLRVPSDSSPAAKNVNGTSVKSSDSDIARSLGISGKGLPNIKGVIKVDPKHIPSLSTGIYIMSKNSGIMKIDTPGKLGPGLNIDQDLIRKQIFAAKQASLKKKQEAEAALKNAKTPSKADRAQIIEKTIITPSGQKIIQRTIQRGSNASSPANTDGTSPMTILNKKLAQSQENSLLRRVVPYRGRGRGVTHVVNHVGKHNKDRPASAFFSDFDFEHETYNSDSSDGLSDIFPNDLGPIPSPSPERELTLDPLTGKRLARAEGEPTPPPTPPPPATPPPEPPAEETPNTTYLMKVEVSPGGTTGMVVESNTPQQSLPSLIDDEVKLEVPSTAVKKLFTEDEEEESEQNTADEPVEGAAVITSGESIMIRGEDGVLYQIAGENEEGQTLLVAAENVEGAGETGVAVAQGEGTTEEDGDGNQCVYVTQNDTGEVLTIDPSQFAQLIPDQDGNGGTLSTAGLQQVAVQVEGEGGEDSTQVIAQLVQADLPSPGGTRRVVLLLPDGSFTMTELDREQYESITEASKTQE